MTQSSLFAIEKIPFVKQTQTYTNHTYENLEFYTYKTFNINNKFIGFIVENLNMNKNANGEYNISLDIQNYSNLILSLEVYDYEGNLYHTQGINNHQTATNMIEATIDFYADTIELYYAVKYESLDVARSPYTESHISFTLPSKDYIVKLSLGSKDAIAKNVYKIVSSIGEEVAGTKIDEDKFIDEFSKNFVLSVTKDYILEQLTDTDEISDDIGKEILFTLLETTMTTSFKNQWLALKDIMDKALLTADILTVFQNTLTYWKREINNELGSTVYINLLSDEKSRGFWGTNKIKDLQSVINKTKQDFPDIPLDSKYFEAIKYLTDIGGVVKGYDDGEFKANQPVTRAEILKMIFSIRKTIPNICKDGDTWKNYTSNAIEYNNKFTDIDTSKWYAKYILCAVETNVANGYEDGSFKANQEVTFAEAFKFVSLGLGENIVCSKTIDSTDWWIEFEEKFLCINHMDELFFRLKDIEVNDIQLNRGETAQLLYGMCEGNKQCKQ